MPVAEAELRPKKATFHLKTADHILDEVTADELRLPGDPPVDFSSDPQSTFWQNEDMDVDQRRKLALISRDPRAYKGSTSREPGDPDPNGATNIAGVYVVNVQIAMAAWRRKRYGGALELRGV